MRSISQKYITKCLLKLYYKLALDAVSEILYNTNQFSWQR